MQTCNGVTFWLVDFKSLTFQWKDVAKPLCQLFRTFTILYGTAETEQNRDNLVPQSTWMSPKPFTRRMGTDSRLDLSRGRVQDQAGWVPEQPDLVSGVPFHDRGFDLDDL